MKETIDSAEASKSQAEELRAEYEDKLTDARQEAAKLVADAQNRAQRAYEAKMADAETDAKRLRSEAEAQIASERDAMLRGARNEVASWPCWPPPRWPSGPRRTATGRWWTPSWRKWVSRHERARPPLCPGPVAGLSRRGGPGAHGPGPDGGARPLGGALLPAVQAGEKGRVLARLPGLEEGGPLPHFYRLLAEKGRMALLPEIVEAFHGLELARRGGARCVLTCVHPLEAEELEKLRAALCRLHHKKEVVFDVRTDPALLGGFTLDIEGVRYDKSVRGALGRMGRQLEERRMA
ncbi:MAG: F0F1 ATP synthase subunit delta [Flavonifractor plautii]